MTEAIVVTDEAPKRRRRRRRKKRLPSDVSVHLATHDDIDDLVTMVESANRDTLEERFTRVDTEYLHNVLTAGCNAGCVLIARRSMGRAIGAFAFIVFNLYYDPSHVVANSFVWWVEPEDRSTGVGAELLRRGEMRAKELGAHTFAATVRSGDNVTSQRVSSMGYTLTESHWSKEL